MAGNNQVEYKNQADKEGPFFPDWHNLEFFALPKEERSHWYVGVPE